MRLSRRRFAQTSLAALAAACGKTTAPGGDDLIIHGGAIYTGAGATVEAVGFHAGRVAYVGGLSGARGAAPARTIDLKGAAAYPGFVDSHVHLTELGFKTLQLDLTGAPSVAALKQALAQYARAHPEGPIIGRGWI